MSAVPAGTWIPLRDAARLENCSGIYIIRNTVTNKNYVGKSVAVATRLVRHLTMPDCGSYLYRSMRKHSIENFECCLYIRCAESLLSDLEIFVIAKKRTFAPLGYNMTMGGEGMLGYRHTESTKLKLSQLKTGKPMSLEARLKMRMSSLGMLHSEATKAKIGAAHVGRKMPEKVKEALRVANTGRLLSEEVRKKMSESHKGYRYSPEARANMSAAQKGRVLSDTHRANIAKAAKNRKYAEDYKEKRREILGINILVYERESTVPRSFGSLTEAAEVYGVTVTSVARWVKREKPTKDGRLFIAV